MSFQIPNLKLLFMLQREAAGRFYLKVYLCFFQQLYWDNTSVEAPTRPNTDRHLSFAEFFDITYSSLLINITNNIFFIPP